MGGWAVRFSDNLVGQKNFVSFLVVPLGIKIGNSGKQIFGGGALLGARG